jgi:hypothetical protein
VAVEVLTKPIEIFYPGNHIDSQGKRVAVSAKELEASVQCFNASGERLPLVPGHPSDDAPAGGYATKLAIVNGRAAVVEAAELDPMFRAIVNSGELNRVSVKFRLPGHHANRTGNYEFRHVGFLGRSNPALKQLKSAQFSTNDGEIILMADDEDKSAEFAEREAEFKRKEAELAAKEAKFAAMAKYEPFVEDLVRDGRLLPTQKSNFVALFTAIDSNSESEFAAADGAKQSAGEFLKGFLNALPKQVEYGEFSKPDGKEPIESAFMSNDDKEPDSGELSMHNEIVASGVDPKDANAYQAAVKKAYARGKK